MPDIIADFHGTLYEDPNEGPLWKFVAKRAVTPLPVALVVHPVRTVAFAMAKPKLQELVERYGRGEIVYDKIYEAFNHRVLPHLSMHFVEGAILSYSRLPETKRKLDRRMLKAIGDSEGQKGILSTGSMDFILDVLPYGWSLSPDNIVANPVVRIGEGSRFALLV